MKYQAFYLFLASVLFFSTGCQEIDDLTGGADAPTVSYSNTSLEAEFYQAGNSPSPSIDWNGAQGTISLGGTAVTGLSVNSTTGQLQWTKLLPPGTHNAEVVVANSEGQVVVPITINNPLSGLFVGTYENTNYFALDLKENGDIVVLANSASDPDRGEGTWTMDGQELSAYYEYSGAEGYSLIGELEQTNSAATISGNYYLGTYEDGESALGVFEVSLE